MKIVVLVLEKDSDAADFERLVHVVVEESLEDENMVDEHLVD